MAKIKEELKTIEPTTEPTTEPATEALPTIIDNRALPATEPTTEQKFTATGVPAFDLNSVELPHPAK